MTKQKSVIRILSTFVFTAAGIAVLLLLINFFAFAVLQSDSANLYQNSPRRLLDEVSAGLSRSQEGFSLADSARSAMLTQGGWMMVIGADGTVAFGDNLPPELPTHYTLNDVARMTRWYLNDYPVYVQTREDGLLVLGLPKDSYAKYFLSYSTQWFRSLPFRTLLVVIANLLLAVLMASAAAMVFYRALHPVVNGLDRLRQEQPVTLKTKGIFREVSQSINHTAKALDRKNEALKKRDQARANWISGVSHDIRTPLSMILGYAQELSDEQNLSSEDRKKAELIRNQSLKLKNLVSDLNLVSSLEYEMQPVRKKEIRLPSLLRQIVAEQINDGLDPRFSISFSSQEEGLLCEGDESLLTRAITNLIQNSIYHNSSGCRVGLLLTSDKKNGQCTLVIEDDGVGISSDSLSALLELPYSAHRKEPRPAGHGFGLPMAYRIILAHQGTFSLHSTPGKGFQVTIRLPARVGKA